LCGLGIVPAYRRAIDGTTRTIGRRARYFRNQVVVVVAIGALAVLVAVVGRSPSALLAWLLLVPACGLFFFADSRALNEWRSELLEVWIACELDFAAYRDAIRANPALPNGTTEGMLMTLPSAGSLVAEQRVLTPTRKAIAAETLAIQCGRADALLFQAIASGIVVGALLGALWMRRWIPLTGLVTLALIPVIRTLTRRWRQARCEAEVAACRNRPGFSLADYLRIRAGLT
jgi:hypothetical protein